MVTGMRSGMCISDKARPAAEREGKEPPLLPAGEGQWVECVNSADIQTGSGGQTEKKKKNSQKNACHKFLDQEPEAFVASNLVSKDLTRSVRSRLKNSLGDALI